MHTGTTILIDFGTRDPRRNLPPSYGRKRGEVNYLSAFSRQYINSQPEGAGGKHFSVPGFGIADFIWVSPSKSKPGTRQISSEPSVMAFEVKLKDWKQALRQAYSYSYFADQSVVVIPPGTGRATENINLFRRLRIGLWSFDAENGGIQVIHQPKGSKAISSSARQKALALLRRRFNLRKFFE
jgi:hypothetical protein